MNAELRLHKMNILMHSNIMVFVGLLTVGYNLSLLISNLMNYQQFLLHFIFSMIYTHRLMMMQRGRQRGDNTERMDDAWA